MTTNPVTPLQSYTVMGLGPYAIPWPYGDGNLVVKVIDQWGAELLLTGPEVEIDPLSTETSGNLYLEETGEVAALHAGKILQITREIPTEQGWAGTSARERGLEAILDALTRIAQDAQVAGLLNSLQIAGISGTLANMGAPGAAYELNAFVGGALANSQNVWRHVFASPVEFPAGLVGSIAKARLPSAGVNTFALKKNGNPGGTVTFSTSDTGVFALSSATGFAVGDVLEIHADPAAGLDALRDVAFVIKGTRL